MPTTFKDGSVTAVITKSGGGNKWRHSAVFWYF